jgi:hypothetical protein
MFWFIQHHLIEISFYIDAFKAWKWKSFAGLQQGLDVRLA